MKFFSARQVTTIVVSLCAAIILTPAGVWAASTATSVHVTDRQGHLLRVSPSGRVYVTDGNGPLTVDGKLQVSTGRAPLVVKGAVITVPGTPTTPWNTVNGVNITSPSGQSVIYEGDGATKLNLTSFTVAGAGGSAGIINVGVQVYVNRSTSSGDCQTLTGGDFAVADRFRLVVSVGDTVNIAYPTPLVLSSYATAGHQFCVDAEASGPSGFTAEIGASGYLS